MAKTKPPTRSPEQREAIEAAVARVVEPLMPPGIALVAVALEKEFGRWRLQVAIEQAPHGVSLDTCQAVSELLDERLEAIPELADLSYDLEVSSPGVDRVLVSARELRFYHGHAVTLRARKNAPAPPIAHGLLAGYDEPSRTLWIHPASGEGEPLALPFCPKTLEVRLNTPVVLPEPE